MKKASNIFPSPAKFTTCHSDEHLFCFLSGDNTKIHVILISNSFSFSDASSDYFLQLVSAGCAERAPSGPTVLLAITCCFCSIDRKWESFLSRCDSHKLLRGQGDIPHNIIHKFFFPLQQHYLWYLLLFIHLFYITWSDYLLSLRMWEQQAKEAFLRYWKLSV